MHINSLGNNLNVIITAERSFAHNWMSFGLWYSMSKHIPDAQFFIKLQGKVDNASLFNWIPKCHIKVIKGYLPGKKLIIMPHFVMVRDLNEQAVTYLNQEENLSIDSLKLSNAARSDEFIPFVDYRSGCGFFNYSECIDKYECPYDLTGRYMSYDAAVNEVRVLQCWAKFGPIYSTISKD